MKLFSLLLALVFFTGCAMHSPQPRRVVYADPGDRPVIEIRLDEGRSMHPVLVSGETYRFVDDWEGVQVGSILLFADYEEVIPGKYRRVQIPHIVIGGSAEAGWITDAYWRNHLSLTADWRRVWKSNYIGSLVE